MYPDFSFRGSRCEVRVSAIVAAAHRADRASMAYRRILSPPVSVESSKRKSTAAARARASSRSLGAGTPRRSPKTPRNGGNFSGCSWMRARSLCTSRLNGGGGSLERTRLWGEIPDLQGKYREILRNQTLLAASRSKIPNLDAVIETDSLCSGTGNSLRRAGNS